MGLRGVTPGEIVFHTQCELPRRNPPEPIAGALCETGAIGSNVWMRTAFITSPSRRWCYKIRTYGSACWWHGGCLSYRVSVQRVKPLRRGPSFRCGRARSRASRSMWGRCRSIDVGAHQARLGRGSRERAGWLRPGSTAHPSSMPPAHCRSLGTEASVL
jgi:hypothetical protein